MVQTLDIEKNCFGIYFRNKFYFENLQQLTRNCNTAWRHSRLFDDENYIYLSIFAKSQDISKYSSNPQLLEACRELVESQQKAATTAKVDFSEMCFFDIMPDHLMKKWFSLRNEAMVNLVKNTEKPKDYNILHKIHAE